MSFTANIDKPKRKTPKHLNIRLADDLTQPFWDLMKKSDIKVNDMVNQMIRYCLKDMK